jgi:DNA-binding XRE family transcriptional regulator
MKNRLKVLRAERDWSQAALAEHLGVQPSNRQRD